MMTVSSLSSSSSLVATDSEDETPPAKKRKLDSAVVVSDLKKKLNEYLVGTHRHFREKLWKEFCIQHIDRASKDNQPQFEICDFLSCVLDNKFCHLEVGSQLNESQDPSSQGGKFYPARVIETIALIILQLLFQVSVSNFCSGSLVLAGHLKNCLLNHSLI